MDSKDIYVVELTLTRNLGGDTPEYLFSEDSIIHAYTKYEDALKSIRNMAHDLDVDIEDGPNCWTGLIHSFMCKKKPNNRYSDAFMEEVSWHFEAIHFNDDMISFNIKPVSID